jgi:hypothetical protein
MKKVLVVLAVLALAGSVFASPGGIIGSPFSFGVVRGLDKDWEDGNIWMATAVSNACQFGKFDQTSHAQVGSWVTASGQYWCFDCGYGYMYSGTKSIILVDQNTSGGARERCYNPTTGAYLGSIPNAYPEQSYDYGSAIYASGNPPDTYDQTKIWSSCYYSATLKVSDYPVTTWTTFATCPATPPMGTAYAWGHVLVVTTSPGYTVYSFDPDDGTLEDSWALSGWSYYLMGLSAGRENAVGDDESVFIAIFSPSNSIYEVEIGDIYTPPIKVQPTSLGMIKSAYK